MGRIVWFGGGLAGPAGVWLALAGVFLVGAYALGRRAALAPELAPVRARAAVPAGVRRRGPLRYVWV